MSELKKVALVSTDYTSSFHQGKYYLEIRPQYMALQLTSIMVQAHVSGLKRTLDGQEEWLALKSNGTLETRFLNELSIAVTGQRAYDKKIQYWKKSSQEITIKK